MTQTSIASLFARPIYRYIDGVIKADDQSALRTEVEEYVLTQEAGQRLLAFLEAYNDPSIPATGAWISGFFGSGKSHLLKMLALILENRVIDGKPMLEWFLPKCRKDGVDDIFLQGALQKAVSIPSRSILFNIDQKADIVSKRSTDAVLGVFLKVFNEMSGYFGREPHIA